MFAHQRGQFGDTKAVHTGSCLPFTPRLSLGWYNWDELELDRLPVPEVVLSAVAT